MNKIISLLLLCMTIIFAKDICEDSKLLKWLNRANAYIGYRDIRVFKGDLSIDNFERSALMKKEIIEQRWYCVGNTISIVYNIINLHIPEKISEEKREELKEPYRKAIKKLFSPSFKKKKCDELKYMFKDYMDFEFIFVSNNQENLGEGALDYIHYLPKSECKLLLE